MSDSLGGDDILNMNSIEDKIQDMNRIGRCSNDSEFTLTNARTHIHILIKY